MCSRGAVHDWGYDDTATDDTPQLVKNWSLRSIDHAHTTQPAAGASKTAAASWCGRHLDSRLGGAQQFIHRQHFEANWRKLGTAHTYVLWHSISVLESSPSRGIQVPDPSRLPSIVPTAICCMGIDPKKAPVRGPLRPYYQYGVVR